MLNGVREAAIANKDVAVPNKLERTMTVSFKDSVHLVSDPQHLDASVNEVFQMMLGVAIQRVDDQLDVVPESVTAVVGFGGLLSGACVVRMGAAEAMVVAGHMTGMEFTELDDTVKDGIGEIGNMLAGAWKSKIPGLAANCGLSVPAVITGRDYRLHVQAPEFQLVHVYAFEGRKFSVTLVCDGIQ